MSSKLYRGGKVPSERPVWRKVAPPDPQPVETPGIPIGPSTGYPAAVYPAAVNPISSGTSLGGQAQDPAAAGLPDSKAAYQRGFHEGQAAARQELAGEAEAMAARMARSLEELSGLRQRFRHEAEEDVVELALAVARRILHRELTVAPEALLGLVKAALEKIEVREVHSARVSRLDAPMVREFLEQMGLPQRVEVIADPALERGAVILASTRGLLDASAETQLSEIERGFADLVRRTQ